MNMSSSRPYLIRAIHEWITDNQLTPYILVNAHAPSLKIPERYVENGKIILNISYRAVHDLQLDNNEINFSARFDGHAMNVHIPMKAVMAIYAKENGQGMVLDEQDKSPPPVRPPEKVTKPRLTLVK